MSISFKARRVRRFSQVLGFYEAARFELAWSLRQSKVNVKVPSFPNRFTLRRFSSDLSVFSQIFIDEELGLYTPSSPRLIIDGGANIGLSSAYYAKKYPNAKVIAVEPSMENCVAWRDNCRVFSNTQLIEGGLWSSSGFLRIANPEAPAWAYYCEAAEEGISGAFRAYTIDEIIDSSGHDHCDLLKLDIEGAEGALFSPEANLWISRVNVILVEVHSEAALATIRAACPEDVFEHSQCGEKMLYKRRA